jgi:hypothetical protein
MDKSKYKIEARHRDAGHILVLGVSMLVKLKKKVQEYQKAKVENTGPVVPSLVSGVRGSWSHGLKE